MKVRVSGKKGAEGSPREKKPKSKTIVSVLAFIILFIIVGTLIWAFAAYLVNNAYTAKVLTDLSDTVKGGHPLDSSSLLTLERVYELRVGLAKTDVLSFLYPVFSAVFLTIGLFILGQVTASQEKISKQTNEISKQTDEVLKHTNELVSSLQKDVKEISENINKQVSETQTQLEEQTRNYEDQLKSLLENQTEQFSQIAKEQQAMSNMVYFESELMLVHNYTVLLCDSAHCGETYDEHEHIFVPMRDSIKELERLQKKLKHDIKCVDSERRESAIRQLSICIMRMTTLLDVGWDESLKTAVERFIEMLETVQKNCIQLFSSC